MAAPLRRLKRILRPGPHVYLASREDMFHVRRLLRAVTASEGGTYIGIIGGLGTLNFLTRITPERIVLVDVNPDQVDYARCFLELIGISGSREEFLESFFSRKFSADETEFLAQRGDPAVFNRTVNRLRNRAAFHKFFTTIRDAEYGGDGLSIKRNDCCRCLRLGGPPRGTPTGYNFLYFGQGWLENDESFARLRSTLGRARVSFVVSSIDRLDLEPQGDMFYFHGSNVLESFPGLYRRFLAKFQHKLSRLDRDATFLHFSTYHPLNRVVFRSSRPKGGDEHSDCAAKVAQHTRGKDVLELIPGPHAFGRELQASSVAVRPFLLERPERRYDVVVSHILYGSGLLGLSRRGFEKALGVLLTAASELVIVEHNSESLDFKGRRVLCIEDLAGFLSKHQGLDVQVEFSKGRRDDRRNMIIRVKRIGERNGA